MATTAETQSAPEAAPKLMPEAEAESGLLRYFELAKYKVTVG